MILSAEKMKSITGISPNIGQKSDILDRAISQAEDFDVKSVLNNVFFTQIDKNKSTYSLLLNGGEYTYNGYTYSFKGLNYAIAYFALARWTKGSNSNATPFGTVVKSSNDSDPVAASDLAIKANEYKSVGSQYLDECLQFLAVQTDPIYTLYYSRLFPTKKSSNINIDIIG